MTCAAAGVQPAPRAEALWPEVRTALAHLQAALAPGEFNPQADIAGFRIAMADAVATTFVPAQVEQFERTGALANLRALSLTTRGPSKMLERGEPDLVVGHFPQAVAALSIESGDASLRHHHLQERGFVCVLRQGHPLAKDKLTLDDDCAAHHLLVSFSGRANGPSDQALAALGRERCVGLTVNQYFTAGKVVANCSLLTVFPASFMNAAGFQEKVLARRLPLAMDALHVTMLWHMRHVRFSSQPWLRARLIEAAQAATD